MNYSSNLKKNLKELLLLFIPISLMSFSTYFSLFVEKLLLAQYSVLAMEAAVNAAYTVQILQIPCVLIALMSQIYVGQWRGSQNFRMIGPGIWQFIWFSCLSMIFTVPLNYIFGVFYFADTPFELIIWPYFYFLIFMNFLFPLGTTLTCFYFGLGKMRLVLFTTIGSQFLKFVTSYLLIFGWGDLIPSLGLMGGALSTLIAQGGLCIILFCGFSNAQIKEKYHTQNWKFQPKLFFNYLQPGFFRALARISMLLSWASISHLMAVKGGDYLLVLSIGGTLFIFLPFFSDALCQAQIILFANILGAKQYHLLKYVFHSGIILLGIILLLLSIPLVIFPVTTYNYFFSSIKFNDEAIRTVFFGIWTSFAFFTFYFIPISFILALKDTKFILFMGMFNWINGFLLMYIAIEKLNMPAEYFWLVLTIMHCSMALLYYWRMKWLESRLLLEEPLNA